MGHSCRALFVRDFLQKSHVKSPKRAFRTRLPPKVTRQVSQTSVSYETSSKSHVSSLQTERFVRAKSAKRAFRTRLPPKVKQKHPSEHTHHAALPSSFASPAPPNNTRSHANPTVTATFTSTTTHDLTIPCACHESFRIHMYVWFPLSGGLLCIQGFDVKALSLSGESSSKNSQALSWHWSTRDGRTS